MVLVRKILLRKTGWIYDQFSISVVRYIVDCSVQEIAVFVWGENVCDTVKVCSVYLLQKNLIFLSQ